MENSICTICAYSGFFLVCELYISGLQIIPLILDHLKFMASVDIGDFSSCDIKKYQFQFLVTFLAVFSGL